MELLLAFYFYFIWFLGGLALALLLRQLNRFRPVSQVALLPIMVIAAMLLVICAIRVVWRSDIAIVGWGFYAYPPILAGIMTFFGWKKGFRVGLLVTFVLNTVIGLIAIDSFLGNFDEHAYSLAYVYGSVKYDENAAFGHILEIINSSIDAILIYLAVTIISQVILYLLLPTIDRITAKRRCVDVDTIQRE